MVKKILYVYKWATMGGVERVFLNRAHAFKNAGVNVSQDIYFLHDSGGKKLLNEYIKRHELGQYLQIVDEFLPEKYDYIHPVDTPEIFDMTDCDEKILFECHTAYKENRLYLTQLPSSIKGVVVPSEKFKIDILGEVPENLRNKIYVLKNFIPEVNRKILESNSIKIFNKIPIVYIGRVDKLKNVEEIIKIFKRLIEKFGDNYLLIIAGPLTPEVDLFEIVKKQNIINRFIYIPPISFEKIPDLLNMVKDNDGIFVSASKGESFGLSVAEAIFFGLPVVVSSIHSHLFEGEDMFLYQLNDIEGAVNKIEYIVENRERCVNKLLNIKRNLSEEPFLVEWGKINGKN